MALLQAVVNGQNQNNLIYPTLTVEDDTDGQIPKENICQQVRKNWRQILNILPGRPSVFAVQYYALRTDIHLK